MCAFIAQLVEHRTGIAEVTGSNPIEALIFFRLLSNCLNLKINCDDHSSLRSTTTVHICIISYIVRVIFTPHWRYELNKLTSLPMCGFIAQLVEHRTGIAEVTGSNPVEALIFFRLLLSNCLRLLPPFAGVLREKNRMRASFNKIPTNYISVESLINVLYEKNTILALFSFIMCQEAVRRERTEGSSIEFIGYRIPPHEQNDCTVLFTRHQSTKVCRAFSMF